MKHVALILFAVALSLSAVPVFAQGPVALMGIDAEDFGHGSPSIYAGVVGNVYSNATNGGNGILVIGGGKNPADRVTIFWDAVGVDLSVSITYVNGPANIAAASFAGYRVIAVVSDIFNTPSGGLTNDENNELSAKAAAVAAFVNGGGGLFGFSSFGLTNPYGYLASVGTFTAGSVFENDIEPTPEGLALGITSTNLDVCCWHDSYLTFPAYLDVLAYYPQVTGQPAAAIGGQQVIITTNCPYSQGFWRNHGEGNCHSGNNADFWPPAAFPMTLGSNAYSKAEACEIINLNSAGGNALRTLGRQLVAAKLNIANGSPTPDPVPATIVQADLLIGSLDPRTDNVKANTPLGQQMNAVAGILDVFNNNEIEPVCVLPPPSPKRGYTNPIELMAKDLKIDAGYPNPLTSSGAIHFSVTKGGNVVLAVYNTLGVKIRELFNKNIDHGSYDVQWDGNDDAGKAVPSGVYFIKLMMEDQATSTKLTVSR